MNQAAFTITGSDGINQVMFVSQPATVPAPEPEDVFEIVAESDGHSVWLLLGGKNGRTRLSSEEKANGQVFSWI